MAGTLTTSAGKTFHVDYAWAPLRDGSCGIGLQDDRPLGQIAVDFDGLESMHYVEPHTGEYDYTGYTVLSSIRRDSRGVHIKLIQGVVNDV